MPYTVELQLSRAAEARFLRMWTILKEEGVSDLLFRLGYRPHVTLAMYHDIDVPRTIAKLERFAARCQPIPVVFPLFAVGPSSIIALPTENTALRRLHTGFVRAFGPSFRSIDHAGVWMPHCTIGMELPAAKMSRAVERLLAAWQPITGSLDRLALIKFRPGEVLWRKRLRRAP